jgi:hypothetical protein
MSDKQGLGTTTVMPPAGPGGPPKSGTPTGGPVPRGGVPIWVFVVALVAVALVAGTVAWLMRGSTPPVGQLTQTTTTSTVGATLPPTTTSTVSATSAAAATTAPKPKPAPKPVTVKNPSLITKVEWSSKKGYSIKADWVQILTGKAAADAATAAGEESPPPNDYFIANASKKLRAFTLPKGTSITVLGWAGADATAKKKLTVGQFMDIMPGGTSTQDPWAHAYYYITTKGSAVTKIEQIFFP